MRKVSLPFVQKITIPADQLEVGIDLEEIQKLKTQCLRVISATQAIDSVIVQILRRTLLREVKSDIEFVSGYLLESEWCTFASKRKLLFAVIERDKLLTGPTKSKLDSDLRKVMQWRNAFAHGTPEVIGDQHVLRYFESKPQTQVLDDAFWERIESQFLSPFKELQSILSSLDTPSAT